MSSTGKEGWAPGAQFAWFLALRANRHPCARLLPSHRAVKSGGRSWALFVEDLEFQKRHLAASSRAHPGALPPAEKPGKLPRFRALRTLKSVDCPASPLPNAATGSATERGYRLTTRGARRGGSSATASTWLGSGAMNTQLRTALGPEDARTCWPCPGAGCRAGSGGSEFSPSMAGAAGNAGTGATCSPAEPGKSPWLPVGGSIRAEPSNQSRRAKTGCVGTGWKREMPSG